MDGAYHIITLPTVHVDEIERERKNYAFGNIAENHLHYGYLVMCFTCIPYLHRGYNIYNLNG